MKELYRMIDSDLAELIKEPETVLDMVSKKISEFNSLDSSELSDEYINRTINELSYIYFSLPYKLGTGSCLWRARKSSNRLLLSHTDELKYPPSNVVDYGRANTVGASVFYAATSAETAFTECRLKEGDYFHSARYELKADKDIYLHRFGDLDSLRRNSQTVFNKPYYNEAYAYALSKLKPKVKLAVQLVDAFFVDRLSRKGNMDEYRVSSRIVNELLSVSNISGIIYPSVEHSGGYNYAIKPTV